ncbi:hypothetical protein QYF36_017885 [Acer negundo]|nr:hypothetical protein QYF36_017885 [Acer negundo]
MKLDRPGPFYFISGTFDHCRNGQRLLVEVMGLHQSPHSPPSTIAAPPETLLGPRPLPSSSAAQSLFPDVTFYSVFVAHIFMLFVHSAGPSSDQVKPNTEAQGKGPIMSPISSFSQPKSPFWKPH